MSVEEHICARCARHMKTCCQESEVYITPGDVERIRQAVGHDNFHELRPAGDAVYLQFEDDIIWAERVFKPDGTRRILRRVPNGDCVFLGSRGCILAAEVRPLLCRIYPYDFNEQGLKDDLARGCPLHLLEAGETILTALDMKIEQARQWHRQLYEEVRSEPQMSSAAENAAAAREAALALVAATSEAPAHAAQGDSLRQLSQEASSNPPHEGQATENLSSSLAESQTHVSQRPRPR